MEEHITPKLAMPSHGNLTISITLMRWRFCKPELEALRIDEFDCILTPFASDSHHAMMVQLDGKVHLSPLDKKKIHKVLDVGTGNGMWAMQVLSRFPSIRSEPVKAPVESRQSRHNHYHYIRLQRNTNSTSCRVSTPHTIHLLELGWI